MLQDLTQMIDYMLSQQPKSQGDESASQWWSPEGGFPKVNLYQEEDELTLTAEIPGMNKADIKLEVKGKAFRLSGKKLAEYKDEDKLIYRERGGFEFDRSLKLPYVVDPEKVEATYENGILTIGLNRAEEDKPKTITIQ